VFLEWEFEARNHADKAAEDTRDGAGDFSLKKNDSLH